jgi:dTDP-4-amino-4,6-dideoxygalactose transaminase
LTARADPGAWSVPLSDIAVDDEILGAASEAVASGWWSTGPRVAEFEAAFAGFVGARHAVAVSSGTAALHLSLVACGCGPGDEVVLPSLNFVAAANVVRHAGAKPVLCDIAGAHDLTLDLNLDPEDAEAASGPRAKAVVALHYGGLPCDMDALLALAERRGLAVIEDAAHAPGASYRGRACGTLGHAGCFSFFSNKNLPIGEGGMVVTDDAALAERVRHLRSHGMTALSWDRQRGHATGYDVVASGLNYRLDEPRAAIGLVQLGRLPAANAARARLAAHYRERLEGVAGLTVAMSAGTEEATSAHHLAVVVLPPACARAELRAALAARRIQTSVHYPPIHRFSAYRQLEGRPLPRTDEVADRLLTLPLYAHMTEEQVDEVADALIVELDAAGRTADG